MHFATADVAISPALLFSPANFSWLPYGKLAILNFKREHDMEKYRITHHDSGFTVSFAAGETVGVFKTAKEAQQTITECEHDDLIFESARSLIKKAVDGLMQMHHLDRPAAQDWIKEAAG